MEINSELKGTNAQETEQGSHSDAGEENLNPKRYQAGKRDFWLVALCEILVRVCYLCVNGLNGLNGINDLGEALGYFLLAMFLFLSYQGRRWAWYLYVGIVIFNLLQFTFFTVLILSQWYWVRYTLAYTALIGHVFEFAGILAMGYFMLIKRDVGYFIKGKRMEQRRNQAAGQKKGGNSKES